MRPILIALLLATAAFAANVRLYLKDGGYQLALANEHTSDRPWLGTYRLLAIYSRDLSQKEVEQNYQAGAEARAVAQSPAQASASATAISRPMGVREPPRGRGE